MNYYWSFLLVAFMSVHTRGFNVDLPEITCSTTTDCEAIEEAVCSPAGLCECPTSSVVNSNMVKCVPVAHSFGSDCEENVQCAVRLSTGGACSADGTCLCSPGYHYLHGRCWKSVGLNGACTTSEHCYENYNYESLSCADNTCVCSPGFYLHASRTYCRRLGKAIGDDCFFDFDCKFDGVDGVCTNSKCQMKESRWDQGTQLKFEQDDQEADVAVADDRTKNSRQGESCSMDAECQEFDPNSECSPINSCWCSRGYFFKDSMCMKELGESCSSDDECRHIANTMCRIAEDETEGYCSCTVLYAAESTNQACVRLRPDMSFNCQKLEEACQGFGPLCYCDMPRCECEPNSHFDEEYMSCWITRGVHETCEDSRDCLTTDGGMICHPDLQTCECKEPDFYEAVSGECRRRSLEIGDPCVEDADCAYNRSVCIEQTCGCAAGYFPLTDPSNSTTCTTGIGGECSASEDCLEFVENSMCDNVTSQCKCDTESSWYVANSDGDTCLEVGNEFGGPCVDIMQCQAAFGEHTVCLDSACVCIEGHHFRDQSCGPIRNLNEKCLRTSHCYLPTESEKAECINGFCECKYEFHPNSENSDCISGGTALSEKLGVFTFLAVIGSALLTSMF